jgi:hypothetical protein
MMPRHFSEEEEENRRLESTKRMVEALQDTVLQMVETFADEHPDCDPSAYPVALGQAFVAQCLKAYGTQGFDAARQQATLITDEMEKAFLESEGGYAM